MENNKTIPKIRFTGFTDAWEQRRLGEVANHRGGTAIEKHFDNSGKYKVISIGSYGLDSKYVDQNIRAISNEITDARVVRKGELTMVLNDKTSNGTIIGRSLLINTDDEYVINQRTEIISPKENLDSDFAYVVLNGPFREKVKRIVQGGTQIYVNYPAVENLEFELPSIEEQQKIGDFFIQLDHLITLHQRKYDKTINIKNVMLEKIFPKDSENLPEIIFSKFAVTWEQRELGELATIVRGASPRPIQDPKWFDEESEIGWLRIADVTEQDGRINYLEQHISKLGQEKTRVLTEPHLLLSIAATVGKPVVNYVKTGVHDGFLIFQEPKFNREFMFQWLEMFRPKWQKYGQPGSQVNLNSDLVKNQRIVLPSEEEQEKIGTFFSQLDHLITLHQRELNSLKNMKKSLLQQMFI